MLFFRKSQGFLRKKIGEIVGMMNFWELLVIVREVAVVFGIMITLLYCVVFLIRFRYEFSSKCYLPWEKEDKKKANLRDKKE